MQVLPCPHSKTLASEISTASSVMPCDLWMENAHASRSGSCFRVNIAPPEVALFTTHFSGLT